jgi:hypothetical protein
MKHTVTETVTVTYEVDIPEEALEAMRDNATGRAANENERHELLQELLDDYAAENQPPREEWTECVLDRKVEESEESEPFKAPERVQL